MVTCLRKFIIRAFSRLFVGISNFEANNVAEIPLILGWWFCLFSSASSFVTELSFWTGNFSTVDPEVFFESLMWKLEWLSLLPVLFFFS